MLTIKPAFSNHEVNTGNNYFKLLGSKFKLLGAGFDYAEVRRSYCECRRIRTNKLNTWYPVMMGNQAPFCNVNI